MGQDDFILWISGCKLGLQEFAEKKFKWSNKLKSVSEAGPAPNLKIKKSHLDVSVNHENDF